MTKDDYIELAVKDGAKMLGFVAKPEEKTAKGIIVIQEAFGVNTHIKETAEKLAKEGYLAIAPEVYHRTAPPKWEIDYEDKSPNNRDHMKALTNDGLLEDLRAAFDYLKNEGMEKIATVGFCMGGRASYLCATALPLAAAVSFYGGGIAQGLLDRTKNINCPLLLIWGGKDAHILPEHTRAVVDSLREHHKEYINAEFGEAEHGFFCDHRKSYHKESAEEAWALTLQFLKTKFD